MTARNSAPYIVEFDPCDDAVQIAGCIVSSDDGNLIGQDDDGLLLSTPLQVVAAICADETAGDGLAGCLISTDANNALGQGAGDGRLFVATLTGQEMADAICADDAAGDTLAACLISTDAGNQIETGTDGKLLVPAAFDGQASFALSQTNDDLELDPGNTGGPTGAISTTIPTDFDGRPAEGLGIFTLTAANQRLVGNGAVNYAIEISLDGGATWIPIRDQDVIYENRAVGEQSQDSLMMQSTFRISTLNSLGAGPIQVRANAVIQPGDQFEVGSMVDLQIDVAWEAGPEYNGVIT